MILSNKLCAQIIILIVEKILHLIIIKPAFFFTSVIRKKPYFNSIDNFENGSHLKLLISFIPEFKTIVSGKLGILVKYHVWILKFKIKLFFDLKIRHQSCSTLKEQPNLPFVNLFWDKMLSGNLE